MRRRDALAHHTAGDGDELEVDVGDGVGIDLARHLLYAITAPFGRQQLFEFGGHGHPAGVKRNSVHQE
jgi:hypothetical protein